MEQLIKNGKWNKKHLGAGVDYIATNKQPNNLTDVFEFGTYRGESLQLLEDLFYMHQIPIRASFGFDSFEGLPAEAPNVERFYLFNKGMFSDINFTWPIRGQYVKCWFNELCEDHVLTLPLHPAKMVHIDGDLYISCVDALEFLFKHNLLQSGSVIAYDEYKSTSTLMAGGESKATHEIADKYKVELEEVFRNEYFDRLICFQNVMVVKSIGQKSQITYLE